MHQDVERVLFSEADIRARVEDLGARITRDLEGKEVVLLALLKGSVIFFADLMRFVSAQIRVDFAWVSSYGATTESSGTVELKVFPDEDLAGKVVVVVDDILDTGRTMSAVVERLRDHHHAAEIRTCVLLDKEARRVTEVRADYAGFEVEDVFVIGYGLDYADRYRNLPYIGVLKPECYEGGGPAEQVG